MARPSRLNVSTGTSLNSPLPSFNISFLPEKEGHLLTRRCHRTGGQIKNNDSADDVKNVDLTQVHYLSGPFEVEGAQPGDILLVEIMDVQPFQDQPWGFTGVFAKENGGGFLDELYPSAYAPAAPSSLPFPASVTN